MITQFLIHAYSVLVVGLLNFLPHWTMPAEMHDSWQMLINQLINFHELGVWVDWNVLNTCVLLSIANWFAAFSFKLIKQIIAHVPAMGGAG